MVDRTPSWPTLGCPRDTLGAVAFVLVLVRLKSSKGTSGTLQVDDDRV